MVARLSSVNNSADSSGVVLMIQLQNIYFHFYFKHTPLTNLTEQSKDGEAVFFSLWWMEQLSMRGDTFECICVHTHVFVCYSWRCTSTCVHACGWQSWMARVFQSLDLTVFRSGLSLSWGSLIWLEWLVRELQQSACLSPLLTRLTNTALHQTAHDFSRFQL